MKVIEASVSRRDVITAYIEYDLRKKGRPPISDLDTWAWHDPRLLDDALQRNELKHGVLSAYRTWWLVQLDIADMLDCAIVDHIFPGEPQVVGQLATKGCLQEAAPKDHREWWEPLCSGAEFPRNWALILRPTVLSERPARWYVEDGSGRLLALLRRILTSQETWRTAWAYVGVVPDERAPFLAGRPELLRA